MFDKNEVLSTKIKASKLYPTLRMDVISLCISAMHAKSYDCSFSTRGRTFPLNETVHMFHTC